MSAVTNTDAITASLSGISVEKTFELDRLPVPAVAYRITSDRSTAAEVKVTEKVPDGVDPNDIGFRSTHDGEFWHRGDAELVWRKVVEPDEEVVTCIGVRTDDDTEVYGFHGRPGIVSVEPVAESEPVAGTTDDGGSDAESDPVETTGMAEDRTDKIPRQAEMPSPGEWQRAVTEPDETEYDVRADEKEDAGTDDRSRALSDRATTMLRIGLKIAVVASLIGGAAML